MHSFSWVRLLPVLFIGAASINAMADADAEYKAGSDFAHQIRGKGQNSVSEFNPSASIPNYTASPDERKYYGGTTASGDDSMKSDAMQEWTTNEATKSVTESFTNNSKESISSDSPFIKASQNVQSRADSIIGKTGQNQCEAQNINRSEFNNYTCERDTTDTKECSRTAEITLKDEYIEAEENETGSGKQTYDYVLKNEGVITSAKIVINNIVLPKNMCDFYTYDPKTSCVYWEVPKITFMGVTREITVLNKPTKNENGVGRVELDLSNINVKVTQGQKVQGDVQMHYYTDTSTHVSRNVLNSIKWGYGPLNSGNTTITLKVKIKRLVKVPVQSWSEMCPFSKESGTLSSTQCTSGPETRQIIINGNSYTLQADCWAFRDVYTVPINEPGNCKTYTENAACTLASRQCNFYSEDGICLHEYATYSCETRTSGQVMICGGDTFCLDGDCERAQKGANNDFAPVVSALAAVAAAGDDVAKMNSLDVRAFTGSARFCKKAGAGFSNCCKDSGWGVDSGLSNCTTEEKALGKAKEDKLTVSVGEFCSKKVLGICLEKKRGYCQFESKLAQIVQQQGRNGQLHISFGAASNPNCRGITQNELQEIKFDQLDFTNFYEDLQKNQKIPDNEAIAKRVREQISSSLQSK